MLNQFLLEVKCKATTTHLTNTSWWQRESMASGSVQVQAPEKLNFNQPQDWPSWIKRFDRYLSVSQVDDDERKVNALV